MKKYFILPILTALFVLSSCSDQLERFPVDSLVDATAFQTVSDLESGLRGAIGGLNFGGSGVVRFNTAFTDNGVIGEDSGGQGSGNLNQVLNPQGGANGLWSDRYNVINRVNRVIQAAESITPTPAEQSAYNEVLGRLYALRGYLHSELLLYYGLDFQDPSALGVPLQLEVTTDAKGERSTTGEVLAAVEADFTLAQSLMTGTDINFPTDDFVTFQRARNALYSGEYGTAVTLANGLINKYPLANPAQYEAMFAGDADTREVIWKFDNVQGANNSLAFAYRFTGSVEESNFISMSIDLFNQFDPQDVRYAVCVAPDGFGSEFNLEDYGIDKYPPNADTQFINDFKAMRISEMYLIRAEAYAMQQQYILAANDVRTIRTIRNSPLATTTYTSIPSAIQDIKDERRVELAFEAHRYIDIKRYRDILNVGIIRSPLDCANNCEMSVTDARFIFPVPVAEIVGNDLISQAPGY